MREFAVVTQAHALLWAKYIGMGSTGPLPCLMSTTWFVVVKDASSLHVRNICRLINSRAYQSPGLFQHGD
jgi:hypothetical protein